MHFIQAHVHLAVIQRVAQRAVNLHLSCRFGRVGLQQGLAQTESGAAFVVSVPPEGEYLESLPEIRLSF